MFSKQEGQCRDEDPYASPETAANQGDLFQATINLVATAGNFLQAYFSCGILKGHDGDLFYSSFSAFSTHLKPSTLSEAH